ncbi:hypothetical protein H2204_007373 [Knufia peltigerae]|uniref:Uncharacterized protein n=1 Tax=Knufia peltigerae TaxID=1002370 RepID=A0AA38Y1S0_9EURO|nr:hypothetical protein H2204_007373 [Knufia peltigerae]
MSTTPTIHVLGVFTESSPFSSLQDKSNATRAEQRLHGRIVLKKQTRDSTSFDHVDVQVHGAIRNTIGSKVVVERFSSSTETLSALDLKPAYSATGQDTQAQEREQEQHLDFSCLVPTMPINGRKTVHEKGRGEEGESVASTTTDDKTNDGFIPSMSISGSTYVTRVTAIRDRHLVQGRCEYGYDYHQTDRKTSDMGDHVPLSLLSPSSSSSSSSSTTSRDFNQSTSEIGLYQSSTTTPSVSSDLLNISYNLVIEMQFTLVDRDGVKTCYNTDLHLPVQLRTVHPPQDVLRTQYSGSFDPLLGYVEEDHVRYAPPPYIC